MTTENILERLQLIKKRLIATATTNELRAQSDALQVVKWSDKENGNRDRMSARANFYYGMSVSQKDCAELIQSIIHDLSREWKTDA